MIHLVTSPVPTNKKSGLVNDMVSDQSNHVLRLPKVFAKSSHIGQKRNAQSSNASTHALRGSIDSGGCEAPVLLA